MNVVLQCAYLVVGPAMVCSYNFFFRSMAVVWALVWMPLFLLLSMTTIPRAFYWLFGTCCLSLAGPTVAEFEIFFSLDCL